MLYLEPEIYRFTLKGGAESHHLRLERERNSLKRDQNDNIERRAVPGIFEEIRSSKMVRKSVTGTDNKIF
jgi:hypothetical protein